MQGSDIFAICEHAVHFGGVSEIQRVQVREAGRICKKQGSADVDRQIQHAGNEKRGVSAEHEGGRDRDQPDGGERGDNLRLGLEPLERRAGDGARAQNRYQL
jgi:hypothetical protein